MGVPSANQRFCGGEQRRGIGTNGGSPGTSRVQNSGGTSVSAQVVSVRGVQLFREPMVQQILQRKE